MRTVGGVFIVLEGDDGVGKTTQLDALAQTLRGAGLSVTTTREPGGSPNLGPELRRLLLTSGVEIGDRAEALLFAADRAEHVRTVIAPALARGEVVLCDRFSDSTLAFQGGGRGLPFDDLIDLSTFATDGLRPDLVVVLDMPPEHAAERVAARATPDRIEAAGLGEGVREFFLSRAAAHPDRYVVVDASGSVEDVAQRLREGVLPRILAGQRPVTVGG